MISTIFGLALIALIYAAIWVLTNRIDRLSERLDALEWDNRIRDIQVDVRKVQREVEEAHDRLFGWRKE